MSPPGPALFGVGIMAAFVVLLLGKQGLSSECIFTWSTVPAMHTSLGAGYVELLMLWSIALSTSGAAVPSHTSSPP